jgi:hypothetical protein
VKLESPIPKGVFGGDEDPSVVAGRELLNHHTRASSVLIESETRL